MADISSHVLDWFRHSPGTWKNSVSDFLADHSPGINLHILSGICAGVRRPNSGTIADKLLFMIVVVAAEMNADSSATAPSMACAPSKPKDAEAAGHPP